MEEWEVMRRKLQVISLINAQGFDSPSLVVLPLPHQLDDFLFPFDLFHLENMLMMSGHDDFVQHRLGVFKVLGEKSK